jgi:IclR family mhp operon transcriptional activator
MPSLSLAEQAGRMDRESQLVEWPSFLAVPSLTHVAALETKAARAFYDHIALSPFGFAVNMLRSASGRAVIAFCEPPLREAILKTLQRSHRPGNRMACSPEHVAQSLAETRTRALACRPSAGGPPC